MKFCLDHWTSLRSKITAAGLGSLVATSGQDVATRMRRAQEEGESIDSFEPLMFAHLRIVEVALGMVGPVAVANEPDGTERCPVCFLNREHEANCEGGDCILPRVAAFDYFIDKAVADAVDKWRELGAAR